MDLSNKKVLVTGGAGFFGKHLTRKLLERGVPKENIFAPQLAELDLRLRDNCEKAVAGANLVIHAAAVTGDVELHEFTTRGDFLRQPDDGRGIDGGGAKIRRGKICHHWQRD